MPSTAVVDTIQSCLLVLTGLFPVVNPVGNAPIFLNLTPGYSPDARSILSRKIALNSYWLLTGSMLIGSHILDFFGISFPLSR
jgi:multiple antibiotic resistance protein